MYQTGDLIASYEPTSCQGWSPLLFGLPHTKRDADDGKSVMLSSPCPACAGQYSIDESTQQLQQLLEATLQQACRRQHQELAQSLCAAVGEAALLLAALPPLILASQLQVSPASWFESERGSKALYSPRLRGILGSSIKGQRG